MRSVKEEFGSLRKMVLTILESNPATRNNDTLLFAECCKVLGAETLDEALSCGVNSISVHKLRQKIQNSEGLYKADETVQEYRKERQKDIKQYMKEAN